MLTIAASRPNSSLLLWAVSATLTLSSYVVAEPKEINCVGEGYSGGDFAELHISAENAGRLFCEELIEARFDREALDHRAVRQAFTAMGNTVKDEFSGKALNNAVENDAYKAQLDEMLNTLGAFRLDAATLPELRVFPNSSNFKYEAYFEPLMDETNPRMTLKDGANCSATGLIDVSSSASCAEVFEDFASALNPYRSAYNTAYSADGNLKLIDSMQSEWDSFLEASKEQTLLEVRLTTLFQTKHFKQDYLVGPPKYQVIALHPRLIYSHMDDAPSGDKQEIGLAIEWAGINFWDWKVPFGASITSVYVDRGISEEVGHGLMLHFWNSYSIGWADHDGDDSIYLSLDLLKLFGDKKQKFDQYMQYF